MTSARFRIIIHGKVQGVFFREFIKNRAEKFSLNGIVRNLDKDKVEIVVEGDKTFIGKLIQECKVGPDLAAVTKLQHEELAFEGNLQGFGIKY